MTKGKLITGGIVLAVLIALGAGYAVSTVNTATAVTTATATTQNLTVTVNASGRVVPDKEVGVYGPVAGTLAWVGVKDGDTVKKGTKLARLDTGPLFLAVAQAESALAAAKAMPKSTRRLRNARNQAIHAATSALSLAFDNLNHSTIKAPAAGVIDVADAVQTGSAVTPGGLMFTIVNPGKLLFEAEVDEADIAAVKVGQKAQVHLDSFPSGPIGGTVTRILSTAIKTDTGGNAFDVRVGVKPGGKKLLRGMSGDVDIVVQTVEDAVVVPLQAVLDEGGRRYVFVVGADHKLVKTPVTIGAATDTLTVITLGVANGAVVVSGQLTGLTDGMNVRVQ